MRAHTAHHQSLHSEIYCACNVDYERLIFSLLRAHFMINVKENMGPWSRWLQNVVNGIRIHILPVIVKINVEVCLLCYTICMGSVDRGRLVRIHVVVAVVGKFIHCHKCGLKVEGEMKTILHHCIVSEMLWCKSTYLLLEHWRIGLGQ